MSAEYSVEEVRHVVRSYESAYGITLASQMLTAFANRIEADERAVPVAKIRHFHYSGIARNGFSQEAQMLDGAPELPDGTKLFTHPPAQAAQVDLQKVFDALHRSAPIPEIIRHVTGAEQLHHEAHAMVRDALATLTADPTHPHSPDAADSGRVVDDVVAYLHTVVQDDGEQDQALSFSSESFPLQGVGGFKSIACRPLVLAAIASQPQSAASPVGVLDGVAIIAAERKRQIDKEGWSPAHDVAEYEGGELASAAACYAMPPEYKLRECTPPLAWPWDESWWKPGDRLRELAKAGALIAAEIDRLAASPQAEE